MMEHDEIMGIVAAEAIEAAAGSTPAIGSASVLELGHAKSNDAHCFDCGFKMLGGAHVGLCPRCASSRWYKTRLMKPIRVKYAPRPFTPEEANLAKRIFSAARGSAPSWSEEFDFDDNSMWVAGAPYTDGEGGTEFYWRLKQRLVGNKIQWYEDSDKELMADPEDPRTWDTLEEAKAAIAKDQSDIIAECNGQNAESSG